MAAAGAEKPGGGPAAASHRRRHLSNPLRKPPREWGEGGGEGGGDGGVRRGPREHAQDLSQSERSGRTLCAGALRRRALDQGKATPTSPKVQTKQGRERARQRAPEEASTRGAGG